MKKILPLIIILCFSGFQLQANPCNGNPQKINQYLNSLTVPPASDLDTVVTELSGLSGDSLCNALNQINPSMLGDEAFVIQQAGNLVRSCITDQTQQRRSFNPPFRRESVWFTPIFEYQERNTQGKVIGYDARTFGIVNGGDVYFNSNFSAGFVKGVLFTDIDWKNNFGYGEMENGFLGLYGTYKQMDNHHSGLYFDASLLGNYSRYTASRNINFISPPRSAHSYHDGWGISGHFGGGYHYFLDEIMITPFAGVDYSYQNEEDYSENNAGSLGLKFASRDTDLIRVEVGSSVHKTFIVDDCLKLSPKAKVSWVYKTPIDNTDMTPNIINQPAFIVEAFDKRTHHFSPGLSLSMIYKDQFTAMAFYEGEFFNDFQKHKVGISANHKF